MIISSLIRLITIYFEIFNSDYFKKDITLICFGNKAIDNIKNLNFSNKILEFPILLEKFTYFMV